MAKVKSYLRLQGSMGETTFLKNGNGKGYRSQDKLVVSPQRFKTDPAFARARENATQFTRGGKGAKLIRVSVSQLLLGVKDKTLKTRLFAKVMEVIKSDVTSPRGSKNIVDGNITLLNGFLFNSAAPLTNVFPKGLVANIHRQTGQLTVDVPAFVPKNELKAPLSATHFEIISAGSELQFEQDVFKTDIQKSALLPYSEAATAALTLTHSVTVNSTLPLFLSVAIKFYQLTGGISYPLLNADTNVAMILAASTA